MGSRRRFEKAIRLRWWIHDPRTGQDGLCPTCDGPQDADDREIKARLRCPFVPRSEWWEERPPIVTGSGEDLGAECECCPAVYARSVVAAEAELAWRWWRRGQLVQLYPAGLPATVVAAVDLADATDNEYRAECEKQRRKDKPHG